ncbi:hypothetical protein [Chryseobacterium sp. MYb7]|uniref:hypothetical protein n=1 Tax=Chryseobacterium sp. MYb7 TaxID=1827290 RepID=UPI000F4E812D|nr:hypothetical protein [Chryseobacterium sp. MYb7]
MSTLLIGGVAYSQVGINTSEPKATLDVVGQPTDLTKPDGITAPRLTGEELKAKDNSYNADQNGTIVFVTASVGTASLKTINITERGYYYFDSTKGTVGEWVKIGVGSDSSNTTANNGLTKTDDNIQLGGNLITPTTITTSDINTLALTGLQDGDAVADRNMVVDANGVIKAVNKADETYRMFHAQLKADQQYTFNTSSTGQEPLPLYFDTPIITSSLFNYNTSSGFLTFTQPGNYLVTLQAGVYNKSKNYVILGIRNGNNYIGRGSFWPSQANGDLLSYTSTQRIGDTYSYSTVIIVPSANYQVRFTFIQSATTPTLSPSSGPTSTGVILKDEIGTSGTGNVTNVTVQKI